MLSYVSQETQRGHLLRPDKEATQNRTRLKRSVALIKVAADGRTLTASFCQVAAIIGAMMLIGVTGIKQWCYVAADFSVQNPRSVPRAADYHLTPVTSNVQTSAQLQTELLHCNNSVLQSTKIHTTRGLNSKMLRVSAHRSKHI